MHKVAVITILFVCLKKTTFRKASLHFFVFLFQQVASHTVALMVILTDYKDQLLSYHI